MGFQDTQDRVRSEIDFNPFIGRPNANAGFAGRLHAEANAVANNVGDLRLNKLRKRVLVARFDPVIDAPASSGRPRTG